MFTEGAVCPGVAGNQPPQIVGTFRVFGFRGMLRSVTVMAEIPVKKPPRDLVGYNSFHSRPANIDCDGAAAQFLDLSFRRFEPILPTRQQSNLHAVVHHMFRFPETLGLIMAAQLLIGRYTGYRLSELFRFRDFTGQKPEDRSQDTEFLCFPSRF